MLGGGIYETLNDVSRGCCGGCGSPVAVTGPTAAATCGVHSCKARDSSCSKGFHCTSCMSSADTRPAWPGSQAQKLETFAVLSRGLPRPVPAMYRRRVSTVQDTPAVNTAILLDVLTRIRLQRVVASQLSGSCCSTTCSTRVACMQVGGCSQAEVSNSTCRGPNNSSWSISIHADCYALTKHGACEQGCTTYIPAYCTDLPLNTHI